MKLKGKKTKSIDEKKNPSTWSWHKNIIDKKNWLLKWKEKKIRIINSEWNARACTIILINWIQNLENKDYK
jgi:hypothetical protein